MSASAGSVDHAASRASVASGRSVRSASSGSRPNTVHPHNSPRTSISTSPAAAIAARSEWLSNRCRSATWPSATHTPRRVVRRSSASSRRPERASSATRDPSESTSTTTSPPGSVQPANRVSVAAGSAVYCSEPIASTARAGSTGGTTSSIDPRTTTNPSPRPRPRAAANMRGDCSMPTTSWPSSTSRWAHRPTPHPASTTGRPATGAPSRSVAIVHESSS